MKSRDSEIQRRDEASEDRAGFRTRPSTGLIAFLALALSLVLTLFAALSFAQRGRPARSGSHSSRARASLSSEARELVEQAIGVVCTERKKDPKGSLPIDEMQALPSLPLHSPEAKVGAERAQHLLPIAKRLVIESLLQLTKTYRVEKLSNVGIEQAIGRVQTVRKIKPEMAARDNASVFLSHPHTINFGTIFLAGLPSDEAMISVLSHELTHIADGDRAGLQQLFIAIAKRASELTGLSIRGQRMEELACDLVGEMAARSFVAAAPNYEPLRRRIARSIEHNCVDEDEGDEDHLSPLNTIRALLILNPSLVRELVYGKDERAPARPVPGG